MVGIGASAGGLEAVSQLLRALPEHPGMAFVLVQHLDPTHDSSLAELLSRISAMPVHEAVDNNPVEVDRVYVIPPNTAIILDHGALRLTPRAATREPHRPIDQFLRSLAEERHGQCFGVVLSGTGSDGTLGLEAIKAEGGITFAQDATADYGGMPQSAAAAGCVDFVLPPEGIARELVRIGSPPYLERSGAAAEGLASEDPADAALAALFALLRKASGVDFAHYKQTTVRRRIQRRMVLHRLDRLEDYVRLLEKDLAETEALYRDLLIHVTSFFRDPDTFEALRAVAFPSWTKGDRADQPIRIWVPGCSTGEEVYSLAIGLLEFLPATASVPIKLFGTDVSEAVIAKARAGRYPAHIAADVSPERLRRFFSEQGGEYQIAKAVRDLCVFARQDATCDPPFSNLDLISCRNTLIYLGPVLQKRVLPCFHYALKEGGFLLLGKSEGVGLATDLFAVVDGRHRLYVRKPGPRRLGWSLSGRERWSGGGARSALSPARAQGGVEVQREADRLVLARYAPAGVVIDEGLEVLQFRGDTGPYLAPPPGPPSHNLLRMAREGLLPDLRLAIEDARKQDARVRREGVRIHGGGEPLSVNLEVTPIRVAAATERCYLVLFEAGVAPAAGATRAPAGVDATDLRSAAGGPGGERVAELERELLATRDQLFQVLAREEAGNDELHAANEEVQSSNEELQSSNEELQTAQEELQATNEELVTINEELQNRNQEATQLNNDLNNLLTSSGIPIAMLGRDLRIRRLTPQASNVLGLLPSDVGRSIRDFRLQVVVPDLEQLLTGVLDTLEVKEREVQDHQGRWFSLSIRPYRTVDNRVDGAVMTLIDVDAIKRSEQRIKQARDYAENIVQTVREPLVILDGALRVRTANRSFHRMFRTTPEEAGSRLLWELRSGGLGSGQLRERLEQVNRTGDPFEDVELETDLPLLGRRTLVLDARRVSGAGAGEQLILLAIADITERRRDEAAKQVLEQKLQDTQKLESLGVLAGGIAHDFNNILTTILGYAELAAADLPPASPRLPYLKQIEVGARRAADLCDQMLAYAGKGRFVVRRFDLSSLVRDTTHLLHLSVGKNATLAFELAPDLPPVQADATQIRQVVMNLVMNAAEAIGEGNGTIVLATGLVHASQAELARTPLSPDLSEGDYVYLEVRDDGCGMTAETKARIFDPFFTTKFTGRGLGLAAVLGIVRGHKGALKVESEPGRGSVFRLLLPCAERSAASLEPVPAEALLWRGEGAALVVDDEDAVRSVIARMLEMLGFRVVQAHDGRDGLAAFRASADPIRLVLLDLTMPHLNGEETFHALRRLRPDLRVILMSGYNAQDVVGRISGKGLAGFLRKPFRLDELATAARDALAGAGATDEPPSLRIARGEGG